jgi:hypothetical protein
MDHGTIGKEEMEVESGYLLQSAHNFLRREQPRPYEVRSERPPHGYLSVLVKN